MVNIRTCFLCTATFHKLFEKASACSGHQSSNTERNCWDTYSWINLLYAHEWAFWTDDILRKHSSILLAYNYVNVLAHHFIPFCIQILSVTLLVIFTAGRRSRMLGESGASIKTLKQQFQNRKETYITPFIIVLSGLSQIIISFIFSCAQLVKWQKHLLCVGYLLLHVP